MLNMSRLFICHRKLLMKYAITKGCASYKLSNILETFSLSFKVVIIIYYQHGNVIQFDFYCRITNIILINCDNIVDTFPGSVNFSSTLMRAGPCCIYDILPVAFMSGIGWSVVRHGLRSGRFIVVITLFLSF